MSHFICSEVLIRAYMDGFFPMADHKDGEIYWHSPNPRAIFPISEIFPNRKERQSFKKFNFTYSIDTKFSEVIKNCSDRDDTWISNEIIDIYTELFDNGFAHSVEVYSSNNLVGGLYGVSINGAFFGESMFNFVPNASKAAFYFLIEHLKKQGFLLLDSQYLNDFTEQLGAIEIPKNTYMYLLQKALELDSRFI